MNLATWLAIPCLLLAPTAHQPERASVRFGVALSTSHRGPVASQTGASALRLICASWLAFADPQDAVAVELDKARDSHAASLEKAKDKLLSDFTKRIEEIRGSKALAAEKKLSLVEKLKAAQQAFEADGTLSGDAQMRTAESEYKTALALARDTLDDAFSKAIDAYTQAGDDGKAAATLKDRNVAIVGEGHMYIGEWTGETESNRILLKEKWTIRYSKGLWSISRRMTTTDGREIATASGQSIKYGEGVLRFRHAFIKKPRGWGDSDKVLKIDPKTPDVLDYEWFAKDAKGTGRLHRAK